MRSRSILLDVIRIASAFWVMSFHWFGGGEFFHSQKNEIDVSWLPEFLAPIFNLGYLGVDIFFILSGAVIMQSTQLSTPKRFIEARFLRLYPVYFLATLLALAIVPIAAKGFNRNSFLFGLSGIQFWAGGETIVRDSWSLAFEVGFYFLVYLAIFYFMKTGTTLAEEEIFKFLQIWLFFVVIGPVLNLDWLTFFTLQGYGAYFILGACLSEMKNLNQARKYIFVFLFSVLLSLKQLSIRVDEVKHSQLIIVFILVVVVLLILRSHSRSIPKSSIRIVNYIKTLSLMTYPIYLFHESLGLSLISIIGVNISYERSFALVFLIIILLSWFSVKVYEHFFKGSYYKYFGRAQ